MLNLKKTAVAVLALGSSAVFAGTMGPVCAPGNVTIPCERTMWEVGADALYLQPIYSPEGNYPQIIGSSSSTGAPQNNIYNAPLQSPNWGWGFMIEGAYHYGMGNDVNVNWYHVNNATSVSGEQFVAYSGAAQNLAQYQNATFSIHPEWDAVNVEFGQHVDFGDMKNIRLHGGVEYARVATGFSSLSRPGAVGGNDFNSSNNSTFNGFGPRGGIDMNYDLGNGFSAYGNGAGGVYVGTGSFNSTATIRERALATATVTPYVYSFNGSKTTLVPELEAKLGLMYHYNMAAIGMIPQSELVLDVGWMWVNYFNAQFSGVDYTAPAAATSPFSRGFISQSDFGEQGLNFGLKWKGNV